MIVYRWFLGVKVSLGGLGRVLGGVRWVLGWVGF